MNEIELAEQLVMLDGDKLVTDSLTVAKSFGKAHKMVLRAYDNLKCSLEFMRHNFVPHEYLDGRGNIQRMVKMTTDGFVMLVMGFTGEAAMAFKEAYIAAFNAMAAYIAQHQQSPSQDAGTGRRGVHALAGRGCPGGSRRIRGRGALGHGGEGGRDGVMGGNRPAPGQRPAPGRSCRWPPPFSAPRRGSLTQSRPSR